MPTASCRYRDDDLVSLAEFRIVGTLSSYSAGNTYGPPELCEPPEGGDLESVDEVSLVDFRSIYGERLDTISDDRKTQIEKLFADKIDRDEKLREDVNAKLFEAMISDDDYWGSPLDLE